MTFLSTVPILSVFLRAPGDPTPAPAPATGGGSQSPFKGIVPDFTIFGAEFTTWWQKLFAGLLAIMLIYTGARLVIALGSMHKARSSQIGGQVDEAKSAVVHAGIAFGGVICFVPLSVAIFFALT